jgi:hypothetical protein
MTVKELTNILATMPQDALVITEGYEDGYDAVKNVSVIKVEENPQKEWYVGKYIDSTKSEAVSVVLLYSGTKEDDK